MPRVSRNKIRFFPLKASGGGAYSATGRKGARRPLPAVSTGDSAQTQVLGHSTVVATSYANVMFGTSSGAYTPHGALTQARPTGVNPTGGLLAEHIRLFQSSEPASWAASGDGNACSVSDPTVPFAYSFKPGNVAQASDPAARFAGAPFYDKWFDIIANQMPDVRKTDRQGNTRFDSVTSFHEPIGNTGTISAPQWAQMQINLCYIANDANATRTNPVYIWGILETFPSAFAQWNSYFTTALLTNPHSNWFVLGGDCYAYIANPTAAAFPSGLVTLSTPQYINGLDQVIAAHDYAKAHGYANRWAVPEFGCIIGANRCRPNDGVAQQMITDLESLLNTWPTTEHPIALDWFNNGGQSWNADGATSTAINVILPTAYDEWHSLCIKQTASGLVPSNTLTPSTTLVPSG